MEGLDLKADQARVFIPDKLPVLAALDRTTRMAIAAHADDLEFMAFHAIADCYGREDQWFTGLIVTQGTGEPRSDRYSDADIRSMRQKEQEKAARMGEYGALIQLQLPKARVMDRQDRLLADDLATLLVRCRPQILCTHSPADRHETHVAVALRTIEALRNLDPAFWPQEFYGCEVWGSLDWLAGADKVSFDAGRYPELSRDLLAVFTSQLEGGKAYDRAVAGRWAANATFSNPHEADAHEAVIYGMDLRPLLDDVTLDVGLFVKNRIDRFAAEVLARLAKLSGLSSGPAFLSEGSGGTSERI